MLLNDEQKLVRHTMRAFAQERLAPNAARWDRDLHFPREELRALGELGAMGVVVPERWGGSGLDYVSLALTLEEIADAVPKLPSTAAGGVALPLALSPQQTTAELEF